MIRRVRRGFSTSFERKQRFMKESSSYGSLSVIYRDDIGTVVCTVDEQYGISFDGTKAYFDIIRDDGDSESVRVPIKDIVYIGDPKNYG